MTPKLDRPSRLRSAVVALLRWFDAGAGGEVDADSADAERIDWLRILPFAFLHAGCLGVLFVGWSWTAVAVAVALYLVRMFAITGVYHRYFSHRSYSLNRFWQAAFAVLGASAVQRGPLWWAAHHRHHHRYSDLPEDIHSPVQRGFLWAHMGWLMTKRGFKSNVHEVPDLARYPELRFLDRFDIAVPIVLALALFASGAVLENVAPHLGVTAWQLVVWGFFISTVALFHGTCTINSLAHVMGSQRYDTGDDSRNSALLAIITLGEGWHNNHHRFPGAARQGFRWWEYDVTYYVLRTLSLVGIVRGIRAVPQSVLDAGRARDRAR